MTTILAGQRLTTQVLQDAMTHTIPNGYAATTTATTGTTEVTFLTSAAMTLRNGRAYRVTVSTLISGNSADHARIFIKRGSMSGTALLDTQQIAIPASGSNGRITFENVAANSTGADLTSALYATIQRASGSTASVGTNASAVSPTYIQVEDVGAASDFPTATAIT